jgi:kynurenine formamidase
MESFSDMGRRLSNWGRWGVDDERGTLNHVTPERVVAAAGSVRTGKVFELSIPLSKLGPQQPAGARSNPIHVMTMLPGDLPSARNPGGRLAVADDMLVLPLQCATQWDGLAHIGYDDLLYNNVRASTSVTAREGATHHGIDRALPGMVGRGVLLDIARLRGVEWIEAGDAPIEAAELERAERVQGVRVGPGDALLVRTGWRRKALVEGWTPEWLAANPGLSHLCADWVVAREIAALACDNHSVEVQPSLVPDTLVPLHCILIRDVGMMFGEMFDLEALADDCAADGQWDFFFSAPPLRVSNGVGSTASPIAVK